MHRLPCDERSTRSSTPRRSDGRGPVADLGR